MLGEESNFARYTDVMLDQLQTPYDYESIMHYDSYAFSKNGLPTIIPIKYSLKEIGQRVEMSPLDILEVQRYYGCVPISNAPYAFLTQILLVVTKLSIAVFTNLSTSNVNLMSYLLKDLFFLSS